MTDNQAEAKVAQAIEQANFALGVHERTKISNMAFIEPEHLRTLLASHAAKSARLAEIDRATANRDAQIAGKSLGEKLYEASTRDAAEPEAWIECDDELRADFQSIALAFAASLTHDETASAVIAAQAEEIAELRKDLVDMTDEANGWESRVTAAEATAAAQSLRIASLEAALRPFAAVGRLAREDSLGRERRGHAWGFNRTDLSWSDFHAAERVILGTHLLSPPQPTPGQEGAE